SQPAPSTSGSGPPETGRHVPVPEHAPQYAALPSDAGGLPPLAAGASATAASDRTSASTERRVSPSSIERKASSRIATSSPRRPERAAILRAPSPSASPSKK